MKDQKNLIITIAISIAILFGFQYFFASTSKKAEPQQTLQTTQQAATPQTIAPQNIDTGRGIKDRPPSHSN